jgi:hypothetical protein
MTHIVEGTAEPSKVRRLQKIGLDVNCYLCGAKVETVYANRALDGRVFFACGTCRQKVV